MNARLLPGTAVSVTALVALFSTAAVVEGLRCSSLSSLANSDTWWHLSSGLWILQSHALPQSGLFSQSADAHWIATSWLYDLKLAIWYKMIGLASIPVFLMFFKAFVAIVTFLLAGGWRGNFWPALALSAIAQYILGGVQPGPAYCSVVFFGIELLILSESRRGRRGRLLFWLIPIFLVWANVHVQFVYGVVTLILFLAAEVLERATSAKASHPTGEIASLSLAAGLSVVATFVTPYFYHPYGVFFSSAFSAAKAYLPDFLAPRFRQPQDYALLLLSMAAFLALGLRRSRDPFQIVLLAGSAALSFYSQRDTWLVTLAAVAVIGEAGAGTGEAAAGIGEAAPGAESSAPLGRTSLAQRFSAGESRKDDSSPGGTTRPSLRNRGLLLAAAVSVAILIAVAGIPRSRDVLLAKAGRGYPVAACNYIREHHLAQPLFNAFEWGGFLTWYLPEYPVAIDGRTELYGDDFVIEYSKVMNADAPYKEFPALADVRTILLPKSAIMADALSTVPGFKVAYSDNVATVLTKEEP